MAKNLTPNEFFRLMGAKVGGASPETAKRYFDAFYEILISELNSCKRCNIPTLGTFKVCSTAGKVKKIPQLSGNVIEQYVPAFDKVTFSWSPLLRERINAWREEEDVKPSSGEDFLYEENIEPTPEEFIDKMLKEKTQTAPDKKEQWSRSEWKENLNE